MAIALSRRELLAAAAALLIDPLTAARAQSGTKIYPASALVDSIGVCVHLSYSNTVYGRFDDIILPRMLECKIRRVRDGVPTGPKVTGREWIFRRGRALVAAGVKFSCVTVFNDPHNATDLAFLERSVGFYDGGVDLFEGPNEPNLGKTPNWPQALRDFQRDLYEYVKKSEGLRAVPVLGPSLTYGGPKLVGDLSAWMDFGNLHPYPGGRWPESGNLDIHIADARASDGDKPLMATEVGYHSALETKRGHPPTSEAMIARYLPRLVLWNLLKGLRRNYIYEFADTHDRGPTDQESNFGLLRANGEPKPAFYAIKNLIALFDDAGGELKPKDLSFVILSPEPDAHVMGFQRADGDYLLALWLGVSGWDIDARVALPDVIRDIDLQFDEKIVLVDLTRFGDDGAVFVEKRGTAGMRHSAKVSGNLCVLRVRRVS